MKKVNNPSKDFWYLKKGVLLPSALYSFLLRLHEIKGCWIIEKEKKKFFSPEKKKFTGDKRALWKSLSSWASQILRTLNIV